MASATHSIIFDTGEPAYAVDRNGTIVAWNTGASAALGYSAADTVGRKCWNLLEGQDAFGNQYCCKRCPLREMALQHKAVHRCKMYFRAADGVMKRFTVSTLVVFDQNDRETLIHMCRKDSGIADKTPISAQQPKSRCDRGYGVLTRRESQVLKHLYDGRTTPDIATLMSISIPTVRRHIDHILHKLHAHSRLEAVAVGRRLDLV